MTDRYQLRFLGYKHAARPTRRFEMLGWIKGRDVAELLAVTAKLPRETFYGYDEVHIHFEAAE